MGGMTPEEIKESLKTINRPKNSLVRSSDERRVEPVNLLLKAAQARLGRSTEYTVSIPDYVIECIEKEWGPKLASRKIPFNAVNAIQAIIRAEAVTIVSKKMNIPI